MELFDLSQISVQDMLLVKAITNHGSISQAAQIIGVSQPTASYRLNKLRQIFSDPIFVSAKRKMSPTVKGQRIIKTFLVQIESLEKLAVPEIFDPASTERSFTIVAKGFQYSAMVAIVPKLFFKETRRAKLFIEQEKDDLPASLRHHDAIDFLALPFESKGDSGIRRFVSPALQVRVYYDGNVRKPPNTIKAFSESRFVVLSSLKSQPGFIDQILGENGYPPRNIVGYAPTSASIAGFIGGTDLIYIGSSFTSALGGENLFNAGVPFYTPPIRHEIRWSISKENETGHTWLQNLLVNAMMTAFDPQFQIDQAEKFVLLSEFEQLEQANGPASQPN